MKNDKKIERKVQEISVILKTWFNAIQVLGNQNAATDRMLEELLDKAEEIKKLYQNR